MPTDNKDDKGNKDAEVHHVLMRELLGRIADKWTLTVIDALAEAPKRTLRFSQLQRAIPGVTQKMLTKTLRELERDGLVSRTIHASVPPRVDYKLTALGESFGKEICGLWLWVDVHLRDVERARREFNARRSTPSTPRGTSSARR